MSKFFANPGEKIHRGLKWLVVWGIPAFLLAEMVAVPLALDKLAGYGVPSDVSRQHFYLTRFTLNLFLETPTIDGFESSTNTRYTGFEQDCNSYIADSILGWRSRPNISCSFLHPVGGSSDGAGLMWIAYDADGFMVSVKGAPRYKRKKPDDVFRIIMLGGSAMAGLGASPLESIPAHAQGILAGGAFPTRPGTRFEVINGGVANFNSAQQYLYLMSELIYYKPDIVLFFYGWTDSINRHGHFTDTRNARRRKSKKARKIEFSSTIMKLHRDYNDYIENSYRPRGAFRIFRRSLSRTIGKAWNHTGIGYWAWKFEVARKWKKGWKSLTGLFREVEKKPTRAEAIKSDFDPRLIRVFNENIRRSVALTEINGFKAAFFLQPIIGVDGKTYAEGSERNWANSELGKAEITRRRDFYRPARGLFSTLSAEFADRKSVCFVDLSQIIKNHREQLYADEGHLNSKGNRIVAGAILDRLSDCGFLK